MTKDSKDFGVFESLVSDLSWFHPNCSRHVAETLLMLNGKEGSYLIRPSSLPGEMAISVRGKDSVKHFNLVWNGTEFVFGLVTFANDEEFLDHFRKQPFIAGESGITTQLKHPYPRAVVEPSNYEIVRLHGQYGKTQANTSVVPETFCINSKSGYLTKLGGIVKNWKLRWFVLRCDRLSYFSTSMDKKPIRVLDLTECKSCQKDDSMGKDHCFSLEFPWRTFYFFSNSKGESEEWVEVLNWKLKNNKKTRTLQIPKNT